MSGVTSAAHERSVPLELGVFAGRAEALGQLVNLLSHAATGDRQAVFISGEPGIGKTTLVEHFIGQLRGHSDLAVVRGHCIEDFAGAEPYYPVFEALRELCNGPDGARAIRALSELAPTWALVHGSGIGRMAIFERVTIPCLPCGGRISGVRRQAFG